MDHQVEKETPKEKWRWFSTPESSLNLVPSFFALVETAIAIGIYVYLAYLGYTSHIVVAAFVAPLFLLRTSASIEEGLTVSSRYFDIIETKLDFLEEIVGFYVYMLVLSISFLVGVLIIKAKVTLKSIFNMPIETISAIPENWWKITGCTDIATFPELVAGSTADEEYDIVGQAFASPFIMASEEKKRSDKIIMFIFSTILLAPVSIPSLLFRISMKGSCLIYLPLIWVARGNIHEQLVGMADPFPRFRRYISFFAMGLVAWKVALPGIWEKIALDITPYDTNGVFSLFVAPACLPKWQIASAVNGLFAWLAFWWFYPKIRKIQDCKIPSSTELQFRIFSLVALILSMYTISIAIYNASTLELELPPIGERWFPWQEQA